MKTAVEGFKCAKGAQVPPPLPLFLALAAISCTNFQYFFFYVVLFCNYYLIGISCNLWRKIFYYTISILDV